MAGMPKMKTTVDLHVSGNGLLVVALQEAVKSTGGYSMPPTGTDDETYDDWFADLILRRADKFKTWLEENSGPQTLGQGDVNVG